MGKRQNPIASVVLLYIALGMAGCGNDDDVQDKQAECDRIAADIRDKVTTQYGQPAQGACNNPSLKGVIDNACAAYNKCEQELADLKK